MAGNIENLRPFTKENASYYGKKGAEAARITHQRRKTMKEQLDVLLSIKIKDKNVRAHLKRLGVDAEDINNQALILAKMINRAQKGDVRAAEFVRDTVGENPSQITQEVESSGVTNDILTKLKERSNGFDE